MGLWILSSCASAEPGLYERYLFLVRLGPDAEARQVDQIKEAASSPVVLIREGAVVAVGNVRRKELVPLALDHLADSQPRVRAAAVAALVKLRFSVPPLDPPSAKSLVQERLRGDASVEVRRAAAGALEYFAIDRTTYQSLVAALQDSDPGVSLLSHEVLIRLSGRRIPRQDLKGWQGWLDSL